MKFVLQHSKKMNYVCKSTLMTAYVGWVSFGALSGGLISGVDKICNIIEEETPKYHMPVIQKPIRGVYHASRIAAYAGFGAGIAGSVAATAPISIPLYIWWFQSKDKNIEPVE